MEFRYEHNGTEHTIRLQASPDGSLTAHIGERAIPFRVEERHGELWLTLEGRRVRAVVAQEGDRRFVNVRGQTFEVEHVAGRRARRGGPAGGGSGTLLAQMPAQVMATPVEEGQAVSAGQTLLVLEAMKMEMRVAAPFDGTLKALLVTVGETVDRGQRLAEVEPA